MSATGSLSTLGVAELLQVASLFRKMGSIRLLFPGQRVITVYFQDGDLSGLTDSGRVWQLGDLLASLGRINEVEKQRLLTECKTRGKRLGQLLVEQGRVTKVEMEGVLRRLTMQSLLFAVENESCGGFEMHLGAVSHTTVMFPMTDFLIEITSAVDELERLRSVLGPGEGALWVSGDAGDDGVLRGLVYRKVQVMAHVDGHKTPMDVAAASPFSPTETLRILCDLANAGVVAWTGQTPEKPLARVVLFPVPDPPREDDVAQPAHVAARKERRTPGAVW
ncbi:MAG: DUF4388 domain-containing protein [Thermoleophilia bacterium]